MRNLRTGIQRAAPKAQILQCRVRQGRLQSDEGGTLCQTRVVQNGVGGLEARLRTRLDGIEFGGEVMDNDHKTLAIMAAIITVLTIINLVILDVPDILRGAMIGLNLAIVIMVVVD